MNHSVLPALGFALLSLPALAAAPVSLAPHRAIYDLSFVRSEGANGIEGARGRIAFEMGGSCEGFTVAFRQVVDLASGERAPRVTDVRSSTFETPGGEAFRFVIDRFANGAPSGGTEGRSAATPDSRQVTLTRPKAGALTMGRDVMFPTAHTRRLIEAALAGETTVSAKTYDGSDDGETVYDSLAVIGKSIERAPDAAVDEPTRKGLAGLKSWPMTISYFKSGQEDRTPVYIVSLEMFENGVSRDLKMDYGALVMRGELKQLEVSPAPKCN